MAESVWADLDAMRNSAAQLDADADEVARMVADLKADLAREGEFWGDDDPGKAIAESYVPGADKAMEGMENLVQAVRSIQSQLASAAETFGQQDLAGAQHINNNNADPTDVTTDADSTGGYRSPTSTPTAATPTTGQSTPQGSTPVSHINPTSTDRRETDDSAAPNNIGQSPSAQSPSAQSADPQSDAPADNDGRDPDGNGGADNSQAPTDDANSTDTTPPGSTAAAPPSTAAANPPASTGVRANPLSAKQSGSGARTAGSTAGTPWSGNSAGTPWSKAPAASSPTSSPSNGAPPRVSPPRPGGRPGADKGAADKNKKKDKRAAPQRPVPQRAETDTEAMRIAREMAARHNLEIRGFESSGIHADTVREMAAALDAMLGRYTLPLHGIEIADLAGAPSRVENRNTEAESDDPAPWIMLDRAAVANLRLLAATVTVPHSTRPTRPERPMYTTILRSLGGALDLAGGFRARTEAQRTLITEYLRVRGAKGDTLARVVSGYKRWRSALSDNCFRNGVFAPAAALAEAFAAVELDGDAASGPAKTLHRLLVTMAKASIFDE
ncbi:WXG100 family type VII secretion target [Nocardia sp. CA-119907]|uniref:WXG100 family type VII secretion target n=1 Tax=Nocardia sp. CA-119907 TaxID=3239973 RepID=UPI003D97DAF6